MNPPLISIFALAALAGASSLPAATADSAPAVTKNQEVVTLSPFNVSDSANTGRYSSLESTSAGRVRMDIMDSAQSISVITEEMVEDISPGRIVEVASYIAGVTDSTLPTSWERTNLRGFQYEGRTVDGMTYGIGGGTNGYQNVDPILFERIEIVKGPNFILSPQPTSPGGTINNVTKKPQFRDFGVATAQWGQFDANSGSLDVNRVVAGKLALRIIGSERKWDNWWKGSSLHSTTLMPGLTYRFSPHAQITTQYVYTNWKASNYFGLPIDPSSGSTTPARILAGVPRDLDIYPDDLFRATRQHEFKLFFTAALPKGVQMRLAAAYLTNTAHLTQLSSGGKTDGGSIDPLTGLWNSGLQYQQVEPYAPSPIATPQGRIFTRAGSELFADPRQFNLQNDYAYILDPGFLRSTTVAGFAYRHLRSITQNNTLTAQEFNIDQYADTPWIRGRVGALVHTDNRFRQAYLSENLALLRNRLILNVAESWEFYHPSGRRQQVGSYGAVIKPAGETVSLYSVYNATTVDATAPRPSDAQQKEFGARLKVWGTGLYLNVSHFDITQNNVAITNPLNTAVPRPVPLLPPIYSDRKARGWEYELRANPTKNLSLIGSYTHFKNRDPNNVRIAGVAEKAGGLLASYSFDKKSTPVIEGFRVAIGVNYLGNRPGDPAADYTVASRPTHLIPRQPTFYLGARTLTNLTLAYTSKQHWGVQVNVDNLLDKEYIQSSVSRYAVFPGTPRNIRVSVRYAF